MHAQMFLTAKPSVLTVEAPQNREKRERDIVSRVRESDRARERDRVREGD